MLQVKAADTECVFVGVGMCNPLEAMAAMSL